MGKASRRKQERRVPGQEGGATPPAGQADRQAPRKGPEGNSREPLVVTLTGEPFQPVRLYWSIPQAQAVLDRLTRLKCIEPGEPGCLEWLFEAEAAKLAIGRGYASIPKERRPIVLGRIRFPDGATMTLDIGSTERAIAAARFFMSRLGTECLLQRYRIVNRLFAADEARTQTITELMKALDENVTVIDWEKSEARLREEVQQLQEAGEPDLLSVLLRKESSARVAAVEDFPMDPADGEDLTHFRFILTTRTQLAKEHFLGHTDMTLGKLLVRNLTGGKGLPGL
jgi:hypothetical protein